MSRRVLVIAPHPDDEAIGCGGTICLHKASGDLVEVVFLTSGEQGLPGLAPGHAQKVREDEALAAAAVLGVDHTTFLRFPDFALKERGEAGSAALGAILSDRSPDLVYLPHPEENHPDHRSILPTLLNAMAETSRRGSAPELVGYEVWSPFHRFDWLYDITGVMERKLDAIRCYASQLAEFRYDRAACGLNAFRGELGAKTRYAEAFSWLAAADGHAAS